MSWSRFITVENLCIAAEVTAAMLLLAFAIPEQRSKAKRSEEDDGRNSLLELARRAFLEEKLARGLERLAMLESNRPIVDCSERLASEAFDAEAIGWVDRLSGTFNRAFISAFLNRWLALPSENRLGSYLSMISLKDYTGLVSDNGPVQVELKLRDLGNRLKSLCVDHAIVARLPPDRYLLLTFDGDPAAGFNSVGITSTDSSDFEAAPESVANPLPLICSVVELSDEISSFEEAVGQLETGSDAANQLGEKYVLKQGAEWSSEIPESSDTRRRSSTRSENSLLDKKERKSPRTEQVAADASQMEPTSSAANPDELPVLSDKESSSVDGENLDDVESTPLESVKGKSADVSAVASNEEIAALFAQIKKHENQSERSRSTKSAETSVTPRDSFPESARDTLDAENGANPSSATNLQIASNPAASMNSQSTREGLPLDDPQPASMQSSATETLANGDSVSADDIASLFAAFKPVTTSKAQASQASLPESNKSDAMDKAPDRRGDIAELDIMSETATADDIAELFKAVQQERKEDKPVPASPKPHSNRQAAKEVGEHSETATADDIAELFKAVQKERKEVKTAPVPPDSSANRKFAQEIEELSETATSDDIAELFKSVKSGLGTKRDAERESPPAVKDDLEGTATADDIAALFASVNRESTGKGVAR